MIQQYPKVLVQPERQHFELSPLEARVPRVQHAARFDEVFEPGLGCLRQVWVRFAMGDAACWTEEGGAVADLFFGEEEELVEGLGGGGFAEVDVDGEVGADVVVCSGCKWISLILKLD